MARSIATSTPIAAFAPFSAVPMVAWAVGVVGQFDECFVANTAFSDAAICRICSCGLRGEQCSCSGASYASKGRNATHCGNCVLPACNAATP